MPKLTEFEKLDYQTYFKEQGDPGFNPAKNKAIIESTIKKHNARIKQKWDKYSDALGERIDAASDYIMYLERGGGNTAEKYFGKRYFAQLRGEKIVATLIDEKRKLFKLS